MNAVRQTLSALTFAAALLFTGAEAQAAAAIPQDERAAVIFSYHRVGEDEYPASNIRREQFEAHVRELTDGDYNVMALPAVIAALQKGEKLPPRTVVLTFDGGHKSIMEYAAPLLLKNNIPFTIFIPTGNMDRAAAQYMSWDDVRKLARNDLVTVGLHPASYERLGGESATEILRQINSARAAYRDKLGRDAQFFAYPFGEYSKAYRDLVAKQGFAAAFGEQSGVAYGGTDLFALPRFQMTESYGSLDRFLMAAHALPLPVTDISPADPQLSGTEPTIGFTVDPGLQSQLKDLSCFAAGQGRPSVQVVGDTRVEIRLERPLDTPRARLNCTMPGPTPAPGDDDTWRWFGMMMTVPGIENWDEEKEDDNAGGLISRPGDDSRG
jgi:peptidoglycan/xylan/chitin deacetylase (PgdA/CDA1 family)